MRRGWDWKSLSLLEAVLLSLLGAACGGGGSSSQPKVAVTVSPGAVSLIVNGTQTFSAAVSGVKGIAIATSNGAVRANNVVTITTTAAHGLAAGQTVTITGVSDLTFIGTFTVASVPSSTTFTYSQTGKDATSGGGSVSNISVNWLVNDIAGGNQSFGTITTTGLFTAPAMLPPAVTATIASTNGASRSSSVVTITTTAAHNFLPGQLVLISGVADASFNGSFLIASVPSTTTFTYAQSGGNATSGGGTVSSVAVKVKAVSIADSTASATAVVNLDSGIRVSVTPVSATVGTNENFQFTATVTGSSNTAVDWFVNNMPGGSSSAGTITTSGLYTAPATPPTSNTVNITSNGAVRGPNSVNITSNGAVRASGTVTITTAAAHGFQAGQSVTIAGVSDTSFNGTFTIASVPSTTTFTYLQTTGPNATSGGGTATSGTKVTITTAAAHGFQAGQSVVIAGVSDSSFNGTFTIASVPSTTTFTYLQTGPSATSGGGTATSGSSTVTIKAVAQADPNRSANAAATILIAQDPTLTSINPTHAAQGALFQDVYLTGTNFLSTSTVRFNGVTLPATAVTAVSSTLLRARVPDSDLATAGTFPMDVQRQNLATSTPQNFTIESVRPALVGTSPDSGTQGGAGFNFNANGGYFGTTTSPAVTAEVDGGVRSASVTNARQLTVSINTSDLAQPGLVPIGVVNSAAAQPLAAANLAVQPSAAAIPSTAVVTLSVGANAKPGAVAINTATGIAVVANHDSNNVTLIDLTTSPPSIPPTVGVGGNPNPIPVGQGPTGVAVDNVRNLAVVVNNGDNSVSIVDLAAGNVSSIITGGSGTPLPFAVGVNSLTGRALVVNQSTNSARVIDLTTSPPAVIGTAAISTGLTPAVAIEPRLNWAVVTPGGAGTVSVVDLGHSLPPVPPATLPAFTVIATVAFSRSTRGIGVNAESERVLLTDPNLSSITIFGLLDQTVSNLTLPEAGAAAAAVNPLTDIGVIVNPNTNKASIIDPRTPACLTCSTGNIPVGTGPKAVAIDPGSDLAVVANEGDNSVTVLSLSPLAPSPGAIRPLHVTQVNLPLGQQLTPTSTLTSATDLPLTIYGKGFVSGSVVRLDGTALPAPSSISDRQLSVTVPATMPAMLAGPRRYALDVVNPGGVQSNVAEFTVVQAVDMTSSGCTAPAPQAVAIDPERDLAVAANPGCNNVALIDLTTGTVKNTVAVGASPQGVAVISRLGNAVVANHGDNTASIVNLDTATVSKTVNVGSEPVAAAIDQDTATAVVVNKGANSVDLFTADNGASRGTVTVGSNPVAVAIDSVRSVAAVANSGSNTVTLIDLSSSSPTPSSVTGFQLPTSVAFDPASGLFLVPSSLINNLVTLDPITGQITLIRVGINPTAVAYNFASSTLLTVNTASNTISVMDFLDRRVRAVIGLTAGGSVADIHPRTNLAVLPDPAKNRVLLLPLPR